MAFAVGGTFMGSTFDSARAQDEAEAKQLTVTKTAYWSRSLGHVAPRSLTDRFPPTVVCLVAPGFCNSPLAPALAGGDGVVQQAQPEAVVPSGDPFAEVMAGGKDHLPSGVIAGARRYLSALQFEVPTLPSDERVSKFEISLMPVPDVTFHFDSPGFRQAILAVLRLIQSEDPEAFMTELEKVGDDGHPIAQDEIPLGVEACPIVADFAWEAGGNQNADNAPERDTDERSDAGVVPKQVDCALGANGRVQDGKWFFDLSLAANAWAEGKLPNNGVLLRPVLPPNLAYGDPDLSTFDQVVFFSPTSAETDDQKPMFTLVTKDRARPVSTVGAARSIDSQVLGASTTNTETFTEAFGGIDDVAPAVDTPAPAVDTPPQRGSTLPALSGTPITEWWVWLLLPMFLAGVYLTTQALTAEPAMAVAGRSGAMTRLIEARKRGDLL